MCDGPGFVHTPNMMWISCCNNLWYSQIMTVFWLFLHLATEAHDDDGLPHTLEHLVFMGSEDYPYKVFSKSNLVYW